MKNKKTITWFTIWVSLSLLLLEAILITGFVKHPESCWYDVGKLLAYIICAFVLAAVFFTAVASAWKICKAERQQKEIK